MIPLLSNVAVQDQTVVSNIVTLDNIMSGVDGAATFGYTLETKNLEVNDKQKQQYAHTHTFDIRVIEPDSASEAILRAIRNNNRLVKVSGHSPDGFFLWDEPTLMAEDKQFDEIVSSALTLTHDTTIGYRGTAPNKKLAVYAGDNALALYDILSGSVDTLNGFSFVSSATGGVVGDTQEVITPATTTENTVDLRSANIFFPFVGIPITASANVVSISGGAYKIGVEFVQSDGSTIISTSRTSDVTTGVQSVTGTTPANTVYIRFVVTAGTTASTGEDIDFKQPMLSLGRTDFTL